MEKLGDPLKILGRTVEEMESLAMEAVARAVAQHHRQGRATYFMQSGNLFEQSPDGHIRVLDTPVAHAPHGKSL